MNKIISSWEQEPTKFKSMIEFLNWFDSTKSIEDTIRQAESDWGDRIIHFSEFNNIKKDACLEIGFGAGRLLSQASRIFKNVYGVDIHNSFDKSKEFLSLSNVSNYSLLHKDELSSVKSNSIDFVFSFIVFQHFHSFNEIELYLNEIKRILDKNGVCHIFYGKNIKQDLKITEENKFNKRECSLFLSPKYFREYICSNGFEIIEYEDVMKKKIQEKYSKSNESGQARVLFGKNTRKNNEFI